jgi:hypothetical protein
MTPALRNILLGSPPLILDRVPGAIAAYSLRKLTRKYKGPCVRVRRGSDNAEMDAGFIGNNLNTAGLLAFCGAGDGFVTTWYDQSGFARHASQVAANSQPRIVNSGAIQQTSTDSPTVRFDASVLLASDIGLPSGSNERFQNAVYEADAVAIQSPGGYGTAQVGEQSIIYMFPPSDSDPLASGFAIDGNSGIAPSTLLHSRSIGYANGNWSTYRDKTTGDINAVALNTTLSGNLCIGAGTNQSSDKLTGNICEFVIFQIHIGGQLAWLYKSQADAYGLTQ